jgi:putative Mg2+ transporter-C (MgtC) family protein
MTAAGTSLGLDTDVLVRLLFATLLGAAVGAEREAGDQPAGLRTHIAVAVGAALFGIISTLGFEEFVEAREETNINVDVTRVASNVVVGIGFLGAGVIFRRANSVRNLTTAASLWAVAAVGLACGTGDLLTAVLATAVLLVSLVLLRPLKDWIRARFARTASPVRIRLVPGADPGGILAGLGLAEGAAGPGDVELSELSIEKIDGCLVIAVVLNAHPDRVRHWISRFSTSEDVESVELA